PVVHRAEELNFLGLARKIFDLAERARSGRLVPEEAVGSTFAITNFGVYGSLFGLPIINQPNVAILGVGGIKKRPVVWESEIGDSIVVRSMMLLSLGHDHRLIDGAYGTQFLQKVVHYLQSIDWEAEL
ncbi:MAG: 2-oxo acid dehydrogenase subunit E2, partial [Fidelibacterota bacterium]